MLQSKTNLNFLTCRRTKGNANLTTNSSQKRLILELESLYFNAVCNCMDFYGTACRCNGECYHFLQKFHSQLPFRRYGSAPNKSLCALTFSSHTLNFLCVSSFWVSISQGKSICVHQLWIHINSNLHTLLL